MKTCLSLCLMLLISLALPVNGTVAAERVAQPCAMQPDGMQHAGMHMEHAGAPQGQAAPDVGQHDGHRHDGNPLCKSGHQCKVGYLLQVAIPRADVDAPSSRLIVYLPAPIPARSGAEVWRPPRA